MGNYPRVRIPPPPPFVMKADSAGRLLCALPNGPHARRSLMSLPLRCLGLLALLSAAVSAELPLRAPGKPDPAILRTLADEPFRVPAEINGLLPTSDGLTIFAFNTNHDPLR